MLSVLRGGWEKPRVELRNRSWRRIREAIEIAFVELAGDRPLERLGDRLRELVDSTDIPRSADRDA